jgi:hypothetical protein
MRSTEAGRGRGCVSVSVSVVSTWLIDRSVVEAIATYVFGSRINTDCISVDAYPMQDKARRVSRSVVTNAVA